MKKFTCLFLLSSLLLTSFSACTVVRSKINFSAVPNTKKVLRETVLEKTEKKLSVFLAKNEYEGMQFVLRSDHSFAVQSVEISDLVCGNAKIPSDEVEIYRQNYINVPVVLTDKFETGYYPDALIPIKYDTQPITVEKEQNQGYWLTVHTSKEQPAGLYTGTVTVTADGTKMQIPVEATVWDFAVPTENHVKSSFGLWDMGHYKNQTEQYYWFFNKYRLSPLGLPGGSYSTPEEYVAYLKTYADNETIPCFGISISISKNESGEYVLSDYSKKVVSLIQEQGFLDKCFIYTDDEPTPDKFADLIAKYQALKKYAPGLENVLPITEPVPSSLINDINRLCIKPNVIEQSKIDYIHSIGNHIWFYTCNFPIYPSPTLNMPDYLVSARLLGWMQKNYNLDGYLYWAATIAFKWDGTNSPRDQWTDAYIDDYSQPAGDGYLVYQGYEGDGVINENVPIPTIRLESLRDGFEDYEYLWVLQQKLEASAKENGYEADIQKVLQSYCRNLFAAGDAFYSNEEKLDYVRKAIAREITAADEMIAYAERTEMPNEAKVVVFTTEKAVEIDGKTVAVNDGMAETTVTLDDTIFVNEYKVLAAGKEKTVFVLPVMTLENTQLADFSKLNAMAGVTVENDVMQIDFSSAVRPSVSDAAFLQNDWTGKTHLRLTLSTPDGSNTKPFTLSVYVGASAIDIDIPEYESGSVVEVEIPEQVRNSIRVSNINKLVFVSAENQIICISDIRLIEKEALK